MAFEKAKEYLEGYGLADRMQAEELMDAIVKSKYSIGDVIKMVKGKSKPVDEE